MQNQENMEIKPLSSSENWDDKQIQILSYGGNSRLDEFLSPYLLELEKDKYNFNVFNLKATEFYIKRLEAFAHNGYFSEAPPSLKEGTKLIENMNSLNLDFPHPSGNDDFEIDDSEDNPNKPKSDKKEDDMIDKLDSNMKEIFETTGDIFQEHVSILWDSTTGIRKKTKEAWDSTNTSGKEVIDKTGQFTKESWDKTKDVSKNTWDKTKSLFGTLQDDLKNFTNNSINKTQEIVEKLKKNENDEKEDKLSFKNLFGIFGKTEDKPKEESKEEQYFDFDQKEDNKDDKSDDNIDHLFMLKEELKQIHEKEISKGSDSSDKQCPNDKPLLDFQ